VIVTQNKFYSSMSMEKEPAGAFNKAQRLNEQPQRIPHPRHLQGLTEFNASGARRQVQDAASSSALRLPPASCSRKTAERHMRGIHQKNRDAASDRLHLLRHLDMNGQ
jgi:hypothetical protein